MMMRLAVQQRSGRTILLGLLVPLVVCVVWAFDSIPASQLRAQLIYDQNFAQWTDYKRSSRWHAANPFHSNGNYVKRLDLESGRITSHSRFESVDRDTINLHGECVQLGSAYSLSETQQRRSSGLPMPPPERRFAYFKHLESGAERMVEFDLPGEQNQFVFGRYYISADANSIYAVDLEDESPKMFSLAAPCASPGPVPQPLRGSKHLVRLQTTTTTPARQFVEVFEIAEHAIKLVGTVEAGAELATHWYGQLVVLGTDLKSVEMRAVDTLQVVRKIELPAELVASRLPLSLRANLIAFERKDGQDPIYYDLDAGVKLNLPTGRWDLRAFNGDDRRYCWFHNIGIGNTGRETCLFDLRENRVQKFLPGISEQELFIDGHRFARLFDKFGVWVEVHDLNTGTVKHWRPYFAYAFLIPFLYCSVASWVVAWLSVSSRESTSIWSDLGPVACLLPLAIYSSGAWRADPISVLWFLPSQLATSYWGVVAALITVGGSWMVAGPTRIGLAAIPVTLVYASYAAIFVCSQQSQAYTAILLGPLGHIAVVGVISILACAVFCVRGRRLVNCKADSSHAMKQELWTLNDLFLLVTCAAVLIAASAPLMKQKVSYVQLLDGFWLSTALSVAALSTVTFVTTLMPRVGWFAVGSAMVTIMALIFVVQETAGFGSVPNLIFGAAPSGVAAVVAAVSLTYIIALAQRLRGWRLGK